MNYKILHCADIHLDTPFLHDGLDPECGPLRRSGLRAALGRVIDLALRTRADALTIAGDLFDQRYVLPDTIDFVCRQFTRLASARVIIAPGEHDPYTSDSIYALAHWPGNVTVFTKRELEPLELAPSLRVWGAACPPDRQSKMLAAYSRATEGTNILLLHAREAHQPADDPEATFEVTHATVRDAGFDLALLGHAHHGRLWPESDPVCLYPGSLEPLTWADEPSSHQAIVLTADRDKLTIDAVPMSQWHYRRCQVDLSKCETQDAAMLRIRTALQTSLAADDGRSLAWVQVVGQPECELDLNALYMACKTGPHVRVDIQLRSDYDVERLAREHTVRGLLLRRLEQLLVQARGVEDGLAVETARWCALRALDGRRVSSHEIR